ncbi:MAG TPA: NAD(P)H-dependent glycerol-3-phosphate dehydrogenase [Candidatus Baltobacteraceae bacterium]|nr:NAD(P)H-dependent glycerol-3-phosphate dehydrogenase [Candidatus Baltobacteraceae bacterium]
MSPTDLNASALPEPVAVIGAGAWGTALAAVLGRRFAHVRLWVYEADLAAAMIGSRENALYLPGVRLPGTVHPTGDLRIALADCPLVLFVVPSHVFRRVVEEAKSQLAPGALIVSATKGLEAGTLATMSQILQTVLPVGHHHHICVLSGPSFAREVALGRPTAVVAAAQHAGIAERVQRLLSGGPLRVYAGTDPLGVELGGAVKNVIAIAAGVVDGLGLGTNARAALITRGLAEMTRLGVAVGADARTFAGLAGMGDLILTATGDLSRNRTLGKQLAMGERLEKILAASRAVIEGVNACRSVVALAERHQVDMPISRAVCRVLFDGQEPREALSDLMTRELRFEGE